MGADAIPRAKDLCELEVSHMAELPPTRHTRRVIGSEPECRSSAMGTAGLAPHIRSRTMKTTRLRLVWLASCWFPHWAFVPLSLYQRPSSSSCRSSATTDDGLARLRVKELRGELDTLGVDYHDCFDKESLVSRLREARSGQVATKASPRPSTSRDDEEPSVPSSQPEPSTTTRTVIDNSALLQEIKALSVKELRQELASRNRRWAGLLEKSDLVSAVYEARLAAHHFSATGQLTPGQVTALTGHEVEQEIAAAVETPLLLDVYAVWCGPCQMMAPILGQVAEALGDGVRVAKMDSDEYPEVAGRLRVNGLPSLILFRGGREVARVEGAMMKDQLIEWVESKLAL